MEEHHDPRKDVEKLGEGLGSHDKPLPCLSDRRWCLLCGIEARRQAFVPALGARPSM
jgi:hypothetical protein